MATDTARFARLGGAASGPKRGLWQVPIFLLGLAAAFFVTVGRPLLVSLTATSAESALRTVRAALESKPPDAQKALDAALIGFEMKPESGEAQFLLGSAYLALADVSTEADAAEYRSRSRKLLEQAEKTGVAESDSGRLTYRLGKVWLLLGVDPQQVVPALARTIDQADDPFEAYGLLAQASLKKNPPDKPAAMEAVRQQLSRTAPTTDLRLVNQARLRLGELALQLQNPKEARAALNRVGSEASPDVFVAARILLARSFSDAQEWAEAARQWEQIRGDSRLKPAERATVLFHLGACYQQEKRLQDAAAAWRDAAAIGGSEGQASGLRLADLLAETDLSTAGDYLAKSLAGPSDVTNWKNPLIPVEDLQSIIEHIVEQVKTKGDSAAAAKIAPLLTNVLAAGRPDELFAATTESSAKKNLEKAGQSTGETAGTLIAKSNEEFREAAKAYFAAAGKAAPGTEQAEWFRRSGDCSLLAQDYPTAIDAFNKFAELENVIGEERAADAWYLIGETQQKLQNFDAAKAAFQKCNKPTSPKRFFSRYTLAMQELNEAKQVDIKAAGIKDETDRAALALKSRVLFDDAEKLLQDNLTELRQAVQLEPTALELSLFGHADAAYERKDYQTAEQRLQGVLQQYPESNQSAKARFRLGKCYWYQASLNSKELNDIKLAAPARERLQRQLSEHLTRGAEQFAQVIELFARKPQPLTGDDAILHRLAGFAEAECYFFMGKYQDALSRYEALADKYKGTISELAALSQVWQCQRNLKMQEKAVDTLQRLNDSLNQMPDGLFDGSSPIHKRDYWSNWLVQAGRQP